MWEGREKKRGMGWTEKKDGIRKGRRKLGKEERERDRSLNRNMLYFCSG